MRVVAGTSGGLRLVAPPGKDVRPTPDRVREAVFNALGSLGAVQDAIVLDLFAGSGALGIEALSRGARHATFVDTDAAAHDAIEANLTLTGLRERATVVHGDAVGLLARAPSATPFDLVLADPPYAFDGWPALLDMVIGHLAPTGIVVVESDRPVAGAGPLPIIREKRYGGTVVQFARPADRDPIASHGDHE